MDNSSRSGTQEAIDLALAQAKRVQRESRLLVQSLARLRDSQTTAQEAQELNEQDRRN